MAKRTKLETKKSKRYLRCNLTEAEILQAGKDLADRTVELRSLEEDKKRVTSDFGAKIAAKEADISTLTNKMQSGYEFRNVTCTETLGVPTPEKKRVIRDDTGELVAIEELRSGELQRELINSEGTELAEK